MADLLSLGLSGAGTVLSAIGLDVGSKAQQSAAEVAQRDAINAQLATFFESVETTRANQRIARQNVVRTRQRTRAAVKDIKEAGRELRSTQRAIIGASGVKQVGSPTDIIQEGRRATAEDVMTTRLLGRQAAKDFLREATQKGRISARQFGTEITQLGAQARQFGAQAGAARRLAPFEIGTTLISGGADLLRGASGGSSGTSFRGGRSRPRLNLSTTSFG
jgi:hypothetical protein